MPMNTYHLTSKVNLNILILDILKRRTDPEHRITQQDILNELRQRYAIKIDRRTITNQYSYLRELGYDVFSDTHGCCLMNPEFRAADLRLMVDLIHASSILTDEEKKKLSARLMPLGRKPAELITLSPADKITPGTADPLSLTPQTQHHSSRISKALPEIESAIEKRRMLSFFDNILSFDGRLTRTTLNSNIVSPYLTLIEQNHYYLIAYDETSKRLRSFRIDRMSDIYLLRKPRTELHSLPEYREGLNLHKIRACIHDSDPASLVLLRMQAAHRDALTERIGENYRIESIRKSPQGNGMSELLVRVHVPAADVLNWALRYPDEIEVLEPVSLRQQICLKAQRTLQLYRQGGDSEDMYA
ncbi:helix-turn-helix transcriptional regulator [Oribacterium sp. HCP28S3_H8]|uniref:helix-turn-helix transcriptional regulator n=1 Tax=Oribacterium sp. HCP28S3_H8 TaxID=3438945 RepID=UPI003F89ABD9